MREEEGIDRGFVLPGVTIGFAITIIVSVWWASERWNGLETALATARSEDAQRHQAIVTMVEDLADRQAKYIGQDGTLTVGLKETQEDIHALEVWLSAKHGELVP